MRKLKLFFACMLMTFLSIGQVWAADEVYKTALFGSSYNPKNSAYTGSFDATNGTFVVTVNNFNNNNNGWTNSTSGLGQIKCGRKNTASVATIITKNAIDKAVTKVAITIDALTASKINSITLYSSSDNSTWTSVGTFTKATGNQTVTISSPAEDLYYKIEFDCASGSSNGLLTLSKVEYYKAMEAGVVGPVSFSPESESFLYEVEVSLSQEDNKAIYYTTDDAKKDNPDVDTWTLYNSASKPTFTETTTVYAAAVEGSTWSEVTEKTFTKATVLSVAEARAAIDQAGSASIPDQYVAGVISKIDSYNSTYHSITYWISDDGTTSNQLQVYSGKGLKGADFSAKEDIAVGADVIINGSLKKYNSTYEFDLNNVIVEYSYKPTAQLSWNGVIANAYSADIDNQSANEFPTLENTNSVGVSYISSNPDVATINASTGEITLVAIGSTTITATFNGNYDYKANSASYTLNVASSILKANISFEENGGIEVQDLTAQTNLPNPLPVITKAGKNFGGWYKDSEFNTLAVAGAAVESNDPITLYAKWLEPYTIEAAKAVIAATPSGTANQYVAGIISKIDSYNSNFKSITYWISNDGTTANQLKVYSGLIGNAAEALGKNQFSAKEDLQLGDQVVVCGTLKIYNNVEEFDYDNIIYSFSRKAEAALAWDLENDIELTVGDAFTAPALLNPNNIDASEITIESSNTELAVVNEGVVTLVAEATGSATISATFNGNDNYAPAAVSYNIIVNAASPVVLTDYYEKVTSGAVAEGTYLIVYETDGLAFNGGLETLDAVSNTIEVEITNDNKIGVTQATAAATFYIDPEAGTIKSASGRYIGRTANSNGLNASETEAYTNTISIDGDGNAVIVGSGTTATYLRYNSTSNQNRFRYYTANQQPIALYKLANEVVKPKAGLAWDPAEDIEITVGDAFTAPTLLNPNSIDATEILIESSNTNVATISDGVAELVAEATGSTTITATFAGNDNYQAATVSYKIKVNPAHIIAANKSKVNFGSVEEGAAVQSQAITVTLTNVAAVTATLGGDYPDVFSITPATLTASGDITVSVKDNLTAGEYSATLTISDDANEATSKVVNLTLTITEPIGDETPISTTSKWVPATAIEDGMQVIITGVKDDVTYAMGVQNNNNRAAVAGSVEEGVFTPGENTMAFTVVAQDGGKYALRASNGTYLCAASSGSNYLRSQVDLDDNGRWTLTLTSAASNGNYTRNTMFFNSSSSIFACYASTTTTQKPIALYVEQQETPEPPTPVYETVRGSLTAGNYYTVCYNKTMTAIQGASLWSFAGKDAGKAFIVEAEAPYVAGTPYLIYAESEALEALTEEVANPYAGDNNGLYGTFSYMDAAALQQAGATHMLKNNEIREIGTNNHLDAYRAYIKLDMIGAQQPAPGRRVRAIPMQENTATDLEGLEATDAPVKVLIDGQIYILRGEKMFDTTGRMVK